MKTRVKTKALALAMTVMMVFAMAPGMAFAEEPAEAPDNEAPTVSENADETEAVENDENLAGDTTDKEQIAPQPVTAPAKAAPSVKITMTINDKGIIAKTRQGSPMANRTVTVRDLDKDGRLTVDEAFIAAHKSYNRYSKNAKRSGYVSDKKGAIKKLWGKNNGINYLTFVNDVGIWSTKDDTVKKGDHLYASINKDPGGNDWYTTFDKKSITHLASTEFTLNLTGFYGMSYPEGVLAPVKDIQIGTWYKGKFRAIKDAKTDEDGNVTLNFKKAGTYYVTARGTVQGADWEGKPVNCPTMAPACRVNVKK